MPHWLLPENIADILPAEARKIEDLRRVLLDHVRLYGYELVMPPLLEHLDSLLTGAGMEASSRTFQLIDQLSGRVLGLRSDITTQVARIDAHLLNRDAVTRLCYVGSVAHTRPQGLHATREPLQMGAELYGHAGLEADREIQHLALQLLALAGITGVRLNLCHVGIVKALLGDDPLAMRDEMTLVKLLEIKDVPGLAHISERYSPTTRAALLALPGLYGDLTILEHARTLLPADPGSKVAHILDELQTLGLAIEASHQAVRVSIDLADLRGYAYESGAIFAAYVPDLPNALIRGGRYDHVGEAFGRARPAVGFSMDLRELSRLTPANQPRAAIRAPWHSSPQLQALINDLRQAGDIVIQNLPGHKHDHDEFSCDREIVFETGKWVIKHGYH